MDQRLLTGLVSSRFSSLADFPSSEDSVTAPKLTFSPLCQGTPNERCALGAKAPPIASSLAWASGSPLSLPITTVLDLLSAAFVLTAASSAAHATTTVVNTYSRLQLLVLIVSLIVTYSSPLRMHAG